MRHADSYQSIVVPDDSARREALTRAVAEEVNVTRIRDWTRAIQKRLARYSPELNASVDDVAEVAGDAIYYAEHGSLP